MAAHTYLRPVPLRLPVLLFSVCLILIPVYSLLRPHLEAVNAAFTVKAQPLGVQETVASYQPTTVSSMQHGHLPQPPPLFTHTPDGLMDSTANILRGRRMLEDKLVTSVSADEASFENVVLPLAHEENERSREANLVAFYQYVAASSELRNASAAATELIAGGEVDALLREDIYNLIHAVSRKKLNVDPESGKLLRRLQKLYDRSGLNIPQGPDRTRFAAIQRRLSTLTASFLSNLREDSGSLLFHPDELHGVPDEVIERLNGVNQPTDSRSGAALWLPLEYSMFTAVERHCDNATTRQRMFIADETRHSRNIALFKEAVVLRDEAARLLGHVSHAALRIEDMMAKTPDTVQAFLNGVQESLTPAGAADLEQLRMLKQAEMGDDASRFFLWDYDFYDTIRIEREQGLDQEKVAEFFPLEHAVSSMFAIFEALFGLHFHRLEADEYPVLFASGAVWHTDVQMYSVSNDDAGGGDFVGYLYLDLHPREGKFGGAANFNIKPGFLRRNGTRSYPATALVCNFPRSTATRPSLLRHNDVVALFHELGHSIHDIVSRTTYACFHGTSTVQDFVEAPSQLLENWCWVPSVIKTLSKHYSYLSPSYYKAWKENTVGYNGREQPPESMPENIIRGILDAKRTNTAHAHLRSVHWSKFDMAVHQPATHEKIKSLDPSLTYNLLRHNITMLDGLEALNGNYDWAHGYTTDSHLFQGYDASNYAYLYSLVFSADMFDSVFRRNPMNGTEGRRYRHTVLERGGSMDEMEILREFLGREPSIDAFHRALRIT